MGRYDRAEEEAHEALRRSPGHPFPISNLAITYRALGRYADAQQIANQAVEAKVETTPTRRLLYQVGLLLGDGSGAAHLAWAKDRPREFDIVSAQAQVAEYERRVREGGELYRRAADMAVTRGLRGTSSGYTAQLEWTEALYANASQGEAHRMPPMDDTEADGPGTVPRFRAAAALALNGQSAEALALVTRAEASYPEATFVRSLLGPVTRAAIALRQQRPDQAIQALDPAKQTELSTVAADAIREYQKVIRHHGVDPFSTVVPLAQLARMTHDVAAELCQRLGLQAMLEGSVSAVGRTTVVALAATDCATGATIAKEDAEVERKEDVLQALGGLTSRIRSSLGESGASLARNNTPIEEATTPSLEALKAYTEAVARRAAGAEVPAVELLERAIAIDPQFALAHTTLSSIYGGFGETGRSEEYARLAYEHRERVSERERLFITYQYHDRVTGDQLKGREALEVWKRTYQKDYRPSNALALLHIRLGDYPAAILEAEDAIGRNPVHAFPRSNLAHALRGAGRYADARRVGEEALAQKLETVPMRRLLYQLGELLNDPVLAQQQIDWAANHPRSFDISGARGQVALYHGKVGEARRLFAETMTAATERGFPQVASGYAAQAAFAEVIYGYGRPPLEQARDVVRSATAYEPQLRAATALALGDQQSEAAALVRRLRGVRPQDTLLQNCYLPVVEASALLAQKRMDEAIAELRKAAPYENGIVAALLPVYVRGEARLRSGAAAEAAREFQAILAHRGADPFSPVVAMAQLGLARAHAQAGAVAESRAAYEALLATWANADPDLPVLHEAREELAKLR
ncbi:hypothetical protein BH18ACI5_BH18ACI5_09820 [soil metagenome]